MAWFHARAARARLALLAGLGLAVGCGSGGADAVLPDQRQTEERITEIARLDIQRAGRVRLDVIQLARANTGGETTRVEYVLRSPASRVEDTDIRGFLDGTVKYGFNQGTAYHMRVGRRYAAPYRREFELKRSLVRWALPALPGGARVASARVVLWAEAFMTDSPLGDGQRFLPLHLYAYPLEADWGAGAGGIGKDDFSDAAPGEASWTEARAGEAPWDAPGALAPGGGAGYAAAPLAMALIREGDAPVTLEGEALRRYVVERLRAGRTLDLLFKLDDQEEDRWGTELPLLSSNFGNDGDVRSKRPALVLEVEYPGTHAGFVWDYVLEPGTERVFPPVGPFEGPVLVAARVDSAGPAIAPQLRVRGGADPAAVRAAPWLPADLPQRRDWRWVQVQVSAAPNRIAWGDTFAIELLETWVEPGPRERQRPELALVAPSGTVYRVEGRPIAGLRYRLEFVPRELGLWRYGWSFRPSPIRPLGGHDGEGLFYVGIPEGDGEAERLREFARYLIDGAALEEPGDHARGTEVNNFIRWAARHARIGAAERRLADSLIAAVRAARRRR